MEACFLRDTSIIIELSVLKYKQIRENERRQYLQKKTTYNFFDSELSTECKIF